MLREVFHKESKNMCKVSKYLTKSAKICVREVSILQRAKICLCKVSYYFAKRAKMCVREVSILQKEERYMQGKEVLCKEKKDICEGSMFLQRQEGYM